MKIQSPWMGRVKGSAGNMTGSKVYDKNVLRAKAFEVSNPNTAAQQTERSFFAQVADCCASVSEEQLRSLFGVKPKGMSRRNALTKQVSKAYSIAGTSKTLDFSKLLAIGNGEKVYSAICQIEDGNIISDDTYTPAMFGLQTFDNTNIVLVVFDTTNNSIKIMNLAEVYEEDASLSDIGITLDQSIKGYCYPTCALKGENVYHRGFGSFIIKTRSEK